MIIDSEKVLSDYLREHPPIEALDARVLGKNPARRDTPWIRVTQLDASAVNASRTDHLVEYFVQADCYAGSEGGQPQANLLARTAREALRVLPAADLDGVVVTSVEFIGMLRLLDTDFEPARERVMLSALVHMHPR